MHGCHFSAYAVSPTLQCGSASLHSRLAWSPPRSDVSCGLRAGAREGKGGEGEGRGPLSFGLYSSTSCCALCFMIEDLKNLLISGAVLTCRDGGGDCFRLSNFKGLR